MHETQLAKRILEEVLTRAESKSVRVVRGTVAEDEALGIEALAFHFAAHARGTPAEGAKLLLELVHVPARCEACGERFLPEHHVRRCPACGAFGALLEGETGVFIHSIDVEEE